MSLVMDGSAEPLSGHVSATNSPTVFVVDDHELLSATLVLALCAKGFDAHHCRPAAPGEVPAALRGAEPGLVLLDLDLGRSARGEAIDGAELVKPLRALGWSVLVVTGCADLNRVAAAVAAGASGWVDKSAPFDKLVRTAAFAARGNSVLSPVERASLVARYREGRAERQAAMVRLDRLSSREWEVLGRLSTGAQAAQIAEDFVTSLATVRAQIRSILAKLEVSSQLAAVALANRFAPDKVARRA
jgi:DNA-binding NarL/FixJ family response regulator